MAVPSQPEVLLGGLHASGMGPIRKGQGTYRMALYPKREEGQVCLDVAHVS